MLLKFQAQFSGPSTVTVPAATVTVPAATVTMPAATVTMPAATGASE